MKDDLKYRPAEMIYGENLRIPAETFVSDSNSELSDPNNFVYDLKQRFKNFRAIPTRVSSGSSYIPKTLDDCSHVFVRVDQIKKSLEAPYEGPFKVIRKLRKQFVIEKNGKTESISLDRLKPASISKEHKSSNEIEIKKKRVNFR